ncbi:hypothetical protein SHLO109777_09435 [Shewanella loihica]|uniref:Phage shock protein B n=1 Tax=Shewanella loihica (strain ATCC BAA-1088 / PV-4) TaxID=323850 RepID=A3QB58_SHELP|nr:MULTISPECIES: hypothetical protein [Shewanella]ABO22706.1 hypothetical protein Shew_0834 [Shewanella loihica PV-4]QYJ83241.1 hypothetical protein K0H80_04230 [Shewanella aegiceratis]QYJ89243.1 hypothetical protein K0H81_15900 [Shewanella halotolerans]QYJ94607.1 hypothetical protein K0I31_04245 [Shewanella spartinae]QYJ98460.1 hypothetical protein K0J45_04255 [Shewanella alkalitolerans]
MGIFQLAAIAIIGAFAFAAFKEHNRRQASVDNSEIDALKAEIDKLKSRIATLEKIVTDKAYQLGDEIDKL